MDRARDPAAEAEPLDPGPGARRCRPPCRPRLQAGSAADPVSAGGTRPWQSAGMLTAPTVQLEQQARSIESSSVYALSGPQAARWGRPSRSARGAAPGSSRRPAIWIATCRSPSSSGPGRSVVMTLNKPGGVGPQRFLVTDPTGAEIGQINQRIRVVREAFELVIDRAARRRAGLRELVRLPFSVLDASGTAYAQVQKVYEGYARARFTSADRYTVQYAPDASPVQRAIALASAIAMDIALYQS